MAAGEVFGSTDPETIARHFGIDEHTVNELQLVASKIGAVRRHPSAQTNFGVDDTDTFKDVQLRGGVYEG